MHNILFLISDAVGLVGVVLMLLAYFLLSISRISSNGIRYHLLNFIGALLVLFSLCFNWNLSSFVVETAWVFISTLGIIRAMLKGR